MYGENFFVAYCLFVCVRLRKFLFFICVCILARQISKYKAEDWKKISNFSAIFSLFRKKLEDILGQRRLRNWDRCLGMKVMNDRTTLTEVDLFDEIFDLIFDEEDG